MRSFVFYWNQSIRSHNSWIPLGLSLKDSERCFELRIDSSIHVVEGNDQVSRKRENIEGDEQISFSDNCYSCCCYRPISTRAVKVHVNKEQSTQRSRKAGQNTRLPKYTLLLLNSKHHDSQSQMVAIWADRNGRGTLGEFSYNR